MKNRYFFVSGVVTVMGYNPHTEFCEFVVRSKNFPMHRVMMSALRGEFVVRNLDHSLDSDHYRYAILSVSEIPTEQDYIDFTDRSALKTYEGSSL